MVAGIIDGTSRRRDRVEHHIIRLEVRRAQRTRRLGATAVVSA